MQKLYLVLAIIGFAIPVSLAPWTLRHPDNLLFIGNPAETIELIFANYVSAAFAVDLVWVFVVFCIWVVIESRHRQLTYAWVFVLLALLFGVSGPFPLFLYSRERQLADRPGEPVTSVAPSHAAGHIRFGCGEECPWCDAS